MFKDLQKDDIVEVTYKRKGINRQNTVQETARFQVVDPDPDYIPFMLTEAVYMVKLGANDKETGNVGYLGYTGLSGALKLEAKVGYYPSAMVEEISYE